MTKKDIQDKINEIRTYIENAKIERATEELVQFAKQHKKDSYRDEAINIKSTKKAILEDQNKNFATFNEIAARKVRLNSQILAFLTQIEDELVEKQPEPLSPTPPPPPPPLTPPSTSSVNWKIIIPIILVVLAVLAYFLFFKNNTTTNNTNEEPSICQQEFKKAIELFDEKKYADARALFVDIKFQCPSNENNDVERYIRLCNEGLEGNGVPEAFKVDNVEMAISPQIYKGKCPVNVAFTGVIYTNQKEGEVIYNIKLSNGKTTTSRKTKINADGTLPIGIPFSFSEKLATNSKMTATVSIESPEKYTSKPFEFNIECIKDAAPSNTEEAIVDSRDGKKYRTKKIGKDTWLLDNMNYNVRGSKCLDCDKHGRHYSLSATAKLCPSGYMLPTVAQLESLEKTLGSFDKVMKTLEIKPAGRYDGKTTTYNKYKNDFAFFWTASKNGSSRQHYLFNFSNKTSKADTQDQNQYYSCRCVKYNLRLPLYQIQPVIKAIPGN